MNAAKWNSRAVPLDARFISRERTCSRVQRNRISKLYNHCTCTRHAAGRIRAHSSRQSSSIFHLPNQLARLVAATFSAHEEAMIRQPRSIRLMKKTAMRTTVASNTGSIGAGPSSGQSDPQHSPVALIVPSSLHVHVLHLSSHSQLSPISLVRSPAHGVPRVALIAASTSRQRSIMYI